MPSISLDQGSIHYEEAGPASGRPVVLVHGFLMAGDVWSPVAARLADRGLRVLAPTWPMGAHAEAFGGDVALPRMAGVVAGFLDALDLTDVVLVGNDSGGAVCQLVAADHGARVGALVLTNCDTLEHCPPTLFKPLVALGKAPLAALKGALAPMRSARMRRSPVAYGLLSHTDIDDLTGGWVARPLADDAILAEGRAFMKGMEPSVTLGAADRLRGFAGPIHLVWGADDKLFPVAHARAFAAAVPVASLSVVPEARTLVMLDQPDRVAALVGEVALAEVPAPVS